MLLFCNICTACSHPLRLKIKYIEGNNLYFAKRSTSWLLSGTSDLLCDFVKFRLYRLETFEFSFVVSSIEMSGINSDEVAIT